MAVHLEMGTTFIAERLLLFAINALDLRVHVLAPDDQTNRISSSFFSEYQIASMAFLTALQIDEGIESG